MERPPAVSTRRRLIGAVLVVTLLPGLSALLAQLHSSLSLPSDMLVMLLGVVIIALVGGLLPGLAAAVVGSLLLNYYFVDPHHTLKVNDRNDALAIGVFAVVAAAVSTLVDLAATRGYEAERATEEAAVLAAANRTRAALLAAVSHDLRTPLAGAKAAVTSLRSADVSWSEGEQAELLVTADESLDRLIRLVENLLDMSRLQAGAVVLDIQSVALEEVVPRALDDVEPGADISLVLPETVPEVRADAGLLERVVANVVANALAHAAGSHVSVVAEHVGDNVELRVVDHGPGVPESAYEQIFLPFQRLDDATAVRGVGLGLALSRGLVEAMSGTLMPESTPGGGLTMVLTMPAAMTGPRVHRESDLVS
jgi:two-component system sensor histidine kinase KdpD